MKLLLHPSKNQALRFLTPVFKASMITQVPSLLRSITNIILWIIMKYPLDLISKHTGYTLTRVSNSESLCCILCVYKPGHTAFTAGN